LSQVYIGFLHVCIAQETESLSSALVGVCGLLNIEKRILINQKNTINSCYLFPLESKLTYIDPAPEILGCHGAISENSLPLFDSFVKLLEMTPLGLIQITWK
jgi:hypothetical protein